MTRTLPIQIIHLSTSHTGGAGIAARRLNASLNQNGYSSIFLSCANESFSPADNEIAIRRTFIKRLMGAILVRVQRALSSETYFTLGSIGAVQVADLRAYSPENSVIHVHNWFNLADLNLFKSLLSNGYRLVFTLHDMRVLTGGCHYSLSCRNYLRSCDSCPFLPKILRGIPPRNLVNFRNLILQFSSHIELICPSGWLQSIAINSQILPRERIHFIPNVHESQNLGFPKEGLIHSKDNNFIDIGIASLDTNSQLKGGDLVSEIVSAASLRKLPINFVFLSDFDSRGESQENFWANIDYLFVPSRADNSPNVIHEAKLRQIPVIASSVGGITELLNQKIDTFLDIKNFNIDDFIEFLETLRLNLDSTRSRSLDLNYLDYVKDALQKTVSVYENLMPKE